MSSARLAQPQLVLTCFYSSVVFFETLPRRYNRAMLVGHPNSSYDWPIEGFLNDALRQRRACRLDPSVTQQALDFRG